jgi:biotin carboxyl carrier protein
MAGLTDGRHGDARTDAEAGGVPAGPDAVRVRLADSPGAGEEPSIVIEPVPAALRMANPTVGVGPFGGVALPPGEGAPDAARGVLAQRHLVVNGELLDARLGALGHGRYRLEAAGERTTVVLGEARRGEGGRAIREVLVAGFRFEVAVEPERIAALRERAARGRAASAHGGPLDVLAIIPGKVVSISVEPGDAVTAGQQLLVVEAMKMQNELRAPRDGTIHRIGVEPGARIEVGDLLVVIS